MKHTDEHKALARSLAMAAAPADPEFFQDVLALYMRSYLADMKIPDRVNSIEFEMLRQEAINLREELRSGDFRAMVGGNQ